MKCNKCKIEMRIDHISKDGDAVYVCINKRCPNYLKPSLDGEKVLTKEKTE